MAAAKSFQQTNDNVSVSYLQMILMIYTAASDKPMVNNK